MPGVDASLISSNWKILQKRLKAGENADESLKRKRSSDDDSKRAATVTKRPRPANGAARLRARRDVRSMGNLLSSGEQDAAVQRQAVAALQRKHDISTEDIGAAYGGFFEMAEKDVINEGPNKTHKCGKYIALDCEMVGTGPPPFRDDVLARVSMVNFNGEQIYDSYVQAPPGIEIGDYRTHVSGIEEEHMSKDVARPFAEVQEEVENIIAGNILVGHAVYNDLRALQLKHLRRDTRDTSMHRAYKTETHSRSPALRNLAQTFLGLTIQDGAHSSLEDARATMMLYKRDKRAFDDYSRRKYGAPRVSHRPPVAPDQDEPSENGAEDEGESLDGEEDEMNDTSRVPSSSSKPAKKQKKKKKKRTKR